jgi:ATP-dependent helicase/nuclease subunit A
MNAASNGKAEIPLETKMRQRRASDPAGSAWVSANAGSGKTYVLSRRVIRLLLSGTPASKLLCLTYTKAAAATMSNRVFGELARWTVMDDEALAREITDIEDSRPSQRRLEKARRLFAEAIETPGGLKIQTIHAFCEAILHQFPLEADLPGRFEVLDDAGKADLLRQSQMRTLLRATTERDTPLGAAFADVVDLSGEFGYTQALATMIGKRGEFRRWIQSAGTLDAALGELAAALGLRPGDTADTLQTELLASPHFSLAYVKDLAASLSASSANDIKQAKNLDIYLSDAGPGVRIAAWQSFLFKKDGEPKQAKSAVTKAVSARYVDFAERFDAETSRVAGLADRLTAIDTFAYTAAVLLLGDAVIGDYEREKRARGALDFDDLIERTVSLLDRSDSAAWVQYKLDRGIDHILVDEAQDTSPAMWTIVERLAEEFFAGIGQRPTNRTLFAVGDEKQSIYSFQGAAPDQFSQKRHAFATRALEGQTGFEDIKLYLSFRSTPDVLAAVDTVFAEGARAGVVAVPADYENHQALRAYAPGHVEIWPMLRDETSDPPDDWAAPLDLSPTTSSVMRLAARIADEIKSLIDGPPLPGTGERIRPRDILILVRKRHGFVSAINRVLKDRNVPVAGADRLTLTDHIAVEDLIALGRVMLISDDDLSLACVLKSPLFGWDDERLFDIAYGREDGRVPLWTALAAKAETDPTARLTFAQLSDWRARSDQIPPYEFYARILGADGGRRRFIARLGSEADDVLDEFLAHALAQERTGAAGLAGFLAGLESAQPTIKREMDETRDEIRVMTVHGAKGLEAGIVFLVDAGGAPVSASHAPKLVPLPIPGRDPAREAALGWVRGSGQRPRAVQEALLADRQRAEEEYRRLLYVAMTRAADRLYICGYTKLRGPHADCWHQTIERSLIASGKAVPRLGTDGEPNAYIWRSTDLPPLPSRAAEVASEAPVEPPDWLQRPPPVAPIIARLTPSTALEEIGLKDAREPIAAAATLAAARKPLEVELLRGTLVHKLLEVLPDVPLAERGRAAHAYLERAGAALDPEQRDAIAAEVAVILSDPDFAGLFAPGSRAEVPIVGEVAMPDGRRYAVSGQIDRLAVTDAHLLILDYKTNRQPPRDVPEPYLVQMALYRQLLREIFPGRTIRAAVLWTAAPRIAEIPSATLDTVAKNLSIL